MASNNPTQIIPAYKNLDCYEWELAVDLWAACRWGLQLPRGDSLPSYPGSEILYRMTSNWRKAEAELKATGIVSEDGYVNGPALAEQFAKVGHRGVIGFASPAPRPPHGHTLRAEAREVDCLGAAVAILAQYPDECRGRRGKVTASAVAEAIVNHAAHLWPETREAPLSAEELARRIAPHLSRFGPLKAGEQK